MFDKNGYIEACTNALGVTDRDRPFYTNVYGRLAYYAASAEATTSSAGDFHTRFALLANPELERLLPNPHERRTVYIVAEEGLDVFRS